MTTWPTTEVQKVLFEKNYQIECLKEENELLREQQKQLLADYQNDLEVLSENMQVTNKLHVENGKLREALEFYANEEIYEHHCPQADDFDSDAKEDGGQVARQALGLRDES